MASPSEGKAEERAECSKTVPPGPAVGAATEAPSLAKRPRFFFESDTLALKNNPE